jgi:hypothetical protein
MLVLEMNDADRCWDTAHMHMDRLGRSRMLLTSTGGHVRVRTKDSTHKAGYTRWAHCVRNKRFYPREDLELTPTTQPSAE